MSTEVAADLWKKYKVDGSDEARQELVLNYTSLVKYVAGRVAISLPPNVDIDDLISNGIFGLMDAVEKFDPERGIKFESYAIARIRGAIIDGMRSADWVPRSVRQKARQIEETVEKLERQFGRSATDEEISASLGVDLDRYYEMLQEVSTTSISSLEEMWTGKSDTGENIRLEDMIASDEQYTPGNIVDVQETKRLLAQAIDDLPERDRLVVALYYYEGLTLKEIGKVLDVTESRVSQIHTKTIMRLRNKLKTLYS